MKIFIIDIDGTICEHIRNEEGIGRMRVAKAYPDVITEINKWYEEGHYICLPPGELVMTSKGMRPIQEISSGELVYTHGGRFRRVIRTFSRPYQGDLVEIVSRNNLSPIRLTSEHPLLLCQPIRAPERHGRTELNVVQWVNAMGAQSGLLTAFAVPKEVEDTAEVTAERKTRYINRWGREEERTWTRKFPVNADFMTLAGYYLAEGTKARTREKTGHVCLCFGKSLRESQYAYEATMCAKRLGLNSRIDVTKYGARVTIFSTPLMAFFEENFGYGSRHKHLPLWVIRLPREKLEQMLAAYTKGDGSRVPQRTPRSNTRFMLASVSRNLLEQMRMVCLKLGYQAYLHTMTKSETIQGRKVNTAQPYVLYYSEPQAHIASKGGMRDSSYQYLRIKKVKRVPYVGLVYNLEVEGDNSYSVSAGALHNCFFTARTTEHEKVTREWLKQHGVLYHQLILNKPRKLPPYTEYHFIDDAHVKATTFKGKITPFVRKKVEIEVFEE